MESGQQWRKGLASAVVRTCSWLARRKPTAISHPIHACACVQRRDGQSLPGLMQSAQASRAMYTGCGGVDKSRS